MNFTRWKGFEFNPQGCLLEQIVDLESPMGIAYERSCEFYKDFHTHDRLMLVFPRGSCSMEVRTRKPQASFSVDNSSVLIIPAGLDHDDEGISSIYDTVAFYPSEVLLNEVANRAGFSNTDLIELKSKCHRIQRTAWLNQLVQEYFFERIISQSAYSEDLAFYERRILIEIFKLVFKREPRCAETVTQLIQDDLVGKAIKFIETNLFSDIEIESISDHCRVSHSTLLRKFKKELGKTLAVYIRDRRLEEAHSLLKSKRYSVGEVSTLVGYANFGAFTDAFKAKYGTLPSSVRV